MKYYYRVLADTGTAWLKDLGRFEDFEDAQNALMRDFEHQMESVSKEDFEAFSEAYFFNSRIDSIKE